MQRAVSFCKQQICREDEFLCGDGKGAFTFNIVGTSSLPKQGFKNFSASLGNKEADPPHF